MTELNLNFNSENGNLDILLNGKSVLKEVKDFGFYKYRYSESKEECRLVISLGNNAMPTNGEIMKRKSLVFMWEQNIDGSIDDSIFSSENCQKFIIEHDQGQDPIRIAISDRDNKIAKDLIRVKNRK